MPPRKKQQERYVQQVQSSVLSAELIAKRTKRQLDELERSNYAEPGITGGEDDGEVGVVKGRARDIISDRRPGPGVSGKRKSTSNVRTALLYKKSLRQLTEELSLSVLPPGTPSYLTAVAPPSKLPSRVLCSVCGYWGNYRCRKCAMPYCDLNCQATHIETRCEKRVT